MPRLPENQVWRPDPTMGVVIPTARQNGPINWNDGVGPFYPDRGDLSSLVRLRL